MKTIYILCLSLLPVLLFPAVKTTTTSGNWSDGAIWSPAGVPGALDKIFLMHPVTLDQNFQASDTIFVCDVLSFKANKELSLNPGTMILVNTATYNGRLGVMGRNAKVLGNYTFQKWVTRCNGNSIYGSPFTSSFSSLNWYTCYRCMGNSWSNIFYYDESVTGTSGMGYNDNTNGIMQRGRGFFYWFKNYNGGKNFPRQVSLQGATDFSAVFDFGITFTPGTDVSQDGLNLVANPFPGTIDWLSNDWTKKQVSSAIYTWNSCTDSYASFAGGVGVNGGSRYIPSMQGFWVWANGTNAQLAVGSGALVDDNAAMMRSAAAATDYVLRLELDGDEVAIRLDHMSGNGFDEATDAIKMLSENSTIYTSSDSVDYAINSLAHTRQVVPVKVNREGTLKITGFSSFYDLYIIKLIDLADNSVHLLRGDMEYIFSDTSAMSFNKRFEVHFERRGVPVSVADQRLPEPSVTRDDETIYIELPAMYEYGCTVKMFDLAGRERFSGHCQSRSFQLSTINEPAILVISGSTGVYRKKLL